MFVNNWGFVLIKPGMGLGVLYFSPLPLPYFQCRQSCILAHLVVSDTTSLLESCYSQDDQLSLKYYLFLQIYQHLDCSAAIEDQQRQFRLQAVPPELAMALIVNCFACFLAHLCYIISTFGKWQF